MVTTIVTIIGVISVTVLLMGIFGNIVNDREDRQRDRLAESSRFFATSRALFLSPPRDEEPNEYTDDPILRKALGTAQVKEAKEVLVNMTIDFDQVVAYSEWTTSKYTDEEVYANCTAVYLKSGENFIIDEDFKDFEHYHVNYLKSRL
jgi:N-acyl-L-homoserine lactone synthetase